MSKIQTSRLMLPLSATVIFLALSVKMPTSGQTQRVESSTTRQRIVSWEKVTPVDAGFSVVMPSTLKKSETISNTEIGQVIVHKLKSDWKAESYMVTYNQYPASMNSIDPKLLFDFSRDYLLKTIKGNLTNERPISLNGYPGREIGIELRGEGSFLLKVYWAKPFLYQIAVIKDYKKYPLADRNSSLSPDAERFLASFQILSQANVKEATSNMEDFPYLSSSDSLLLTKESAKRGISKAEFARFFFDLVGNGIALLSLNEQMEIKRIREQSSSAFSSEERDEYNSLYNKSLSRKPLSKEDEEHANQLLKKAFFSLPNTTLIRFQTLIGKAFRAALTAQ